MMLWRAKVQTNISGHRYLWETSEVKLKQLVKNSYPGYSYSQERVEVPTAKTKLADWLNEYTNR